MWPFDDPGSQLCFFLYFGKGIRLTFRKVVIFYFHYIGSLKLICEIFLLPNNMQEVMGQFFKNVHSFIHSNVHTRIHVKTAFA